MIGRTLALCMLVFGLAIAMAACDGDEDSDGATSTSTAEAAPSEEVSTPTADGSAASGVTLTWWGQSMFVLTSRQGTSILIDPYRGILGYRVPDPAEIDVAAVTVSHEMPDHDNVEVGGDAVVLRGLTDDGWAEIDERPAEDIRIRTVASFHDGSEGAELGRNAIFVFEVSDLRIVHLGDLGQPLSQDQIDAIGPVDVLLVPVGGTFTIDAAGATEVVEQLGPRVVIPIHYGTEALTFQLDPVDVFLEGKQVEEQGSTVLLDANALPAPGDAVVWVLEPLGG